MKRIYGHIGAIAALAVIAAAAGWYLGGRVPETKYATGSSNGEPAEDSSEANRARGDASNQAGATRESSEEVPLFFFPAVGDRKDSASDAWETAIEEVKMAAEAGIHRYVAPAFLAWDGTKWDPDAALEFVHQIVEIDPEAVCYLHVDLNPPSTWLDAHPVEQAQVAGSKAPYASIASQPWLEDAHEALERLADAVQDSPSSAHIAGTILAAQEQGYWTIRRSVDTSEANVKGFRRWAVDRYGTDDAIQEAWGNGEVTLKELGLPELPEGTDTEKVFFDLPGMQAHVDFQQYMSEQTAEVIEQLTTGLKEHLGSNHRVLAPYGFTFEFLDNASGHLSLEPLLDSAVDGFVSPVSFVNRGLGGPGGFMGPVDSARLHGKTWYVLDDTRTGLAESNSQSEDAEISGPQLEDIYYVHARNFAAALCHGLGLVWTDPGGDGALLDRGMWNRFSRFKDMYRAMNTRGPDERSDAVGMPGQGGTGTASSFRASILGPPVLTVVVDERARFYQRSEGPLNKRLLHEARDAAMQSGVPVRFILLGDLLAGRVRPSDVCLFVNAFLMSPDEREILHALLAQAQATAIWLYAPGYIEEGAYSAEHTASLTGLPVEAFDGGGQSGSVWALPGTWMDEDAAIGEELQWNPLLYIEETDDVDVLARYRDSEEVSIAAGFFEDGWGSIFVAEPKMTPGLLRELLRILEQHVYITPSELPTYETVFFGGDYMGIHAGGPGERIFSLPRSFDVQDALDPERGWYAKQQIPLLMQAGETRLLDLALPSAEAAAPQK